MKRSFIALGAAIAVFVPAAAAAFLFPCTAFAIEHKNLEDGRPTRLDDAYSISQGEIVLQTGAGFGVMSSDDIRGELPLEIKYGLLPNLDFQLSGSLGAVRQGGFEQTSGGLGLAALYNFNQETLWLPAFGIRPSVRVPIGADFR